MKNTEILGTFIFLNRDSIIEPIWDLIAGLGV